MVKEKVRIHSEGLGKRPGMRLYDRWEGILLLVTGWVCGLLFREILRWNVWDVLKKIGGELWK